jgi:hypothetical protein
VPTKLMGFRDPSLHNPTKHIASYTVEAIIPLRDFLHRGAGRDIDEKGGKERLYSVWYSYI